MMTIKKFIGKKTEDDILIENYKRILKEHPDEKMPDIHLKLGKSYERIGEKETAIEEYAMAATLYFHAQEIYGACACNYLITNIDPSNRDALANLALIQFQTGITVSKEDGAIFLQNLGITLDKYEQISEHQEGSSQQNRQDHIADHRMKKDDSSSNPPTEFTKKRTKEEREHDAHFQKDREALVDLIEGNVVAETPFDKSDLKEEREQGAHFQRDREALVELIEREIVAEAQFDKSDLIERKQQFDIVNKNLDVTNSSAPIFRKEENSSEQNILVDLTQDQTSQISKALELKQPVLVDFTQNSFDVHEEGSPVPPEGGNVNLHQTIPLFSELSQTEFDLIIQKATISTYTENMCIMRGRNEQQRFFVILDGTISLQIEFYEEEREAFTILLTKGDFWGEHSFLRQKGVSLNALAKTPCTILELPKTSLISLAQRYTGILDTLKNTCKRRCFYPVISQCSLFTHLTSQERQDIAEYFFTLNVKKGTEIITEGQHDSGLFLIKSGEVEVRTTLVEQEDFHIISTDRKQIRLATLTAGDIFGEGTFFTKEPRSATVSALIDTELLKLPAQNLTRMLKNYPYIEVLLKEIHQQRMINTVKILQDIL
ncbi:cyclic nucleotide-binding domain protein [Candidatus Vecturithrix granuli]|uniref:Cyclic nucleotide-binding domain protein n=1 Tax=Vecturithrix granuli TaxID=1499967 RepID=A0A0S6W9D4_VECG1|nr:cyclic nucleotide-binding domain protein [Candidatus Vecturithrix granuli]